MINDKFVQRKIFSRGQIQPGTDLITKIYVMNVKDMNVNRADQWTGNMG